MRACGPNAAASASARNSHGIAPSATRPGASACPRRRQQGLQTAVGEVLRVKGRLPRSGSSVWSLSAVRTLRVRLGPA